MKSNRFIGSVLMFNFVSGPAWAASATDYKSSIPLGESPDLNLQRGSEYFNQPAQTGNSLLVPVNVIGSVNKPGLHHVPLNTDLITLIALAGGPSADADFKNLTIRRWVGKEETVVRLDGDKLMSSLNATVPTLQSNDVIYVKKKEYWIDPGTATTITAVSAVLAAVATTITIIVGVKGLR